MALITFPRVFANLTTALLSYLDDNFNAINTAFGAATGVSATPGANIIPIAGAASMLAQGFLTVRFDSGESMPLRILRGKFIGSTSSISAGTGWTLTRNSTGQYSITFSAAFTGTPVGVASGSTPLTVAHVQTGGSSMNILCYNQNLTAVDDTVDFIVIGPN